MSGQVEADPGGDPTGDGAAAQPPHSVNDNGEAHDVSPGWFDVHQWNDSSWSQWEDRGHQSWGRDWQLSGQLWATDQASAWERRQSWDTTTAGTAANADHWSSSSDDPWSRGRDPWAARAPHEGRQAQGSGRADHRGDPRADGRAGHPHGSDQGDRGPGSWTGSHGYDDSGVAWNGWSHYDGGGFQAGSSDHRTVATGGRASERLAVPTFTGEDTDDIGNSARSYLRQVEAWRRMTYLPLSQQGLVLYQNLGGKAWVAAEELSVPRLASDGGVSYLVEWINARFLDLEVARIGKAFSDFFRRLKRRQGQSIRDYNSEYDRLHARLREVGCSIPQECAAWLYIDRLQLDEAQELNLLASVGNEYNLYRLQQAAVLHDRGHRKPWENNRSRKPYTAHLTENAEDGHSDGDERDGEDGIELEDGVPEDVAVAYATYQSAKDRYKDQTKARGYQGDRPGGAPKEAPKKSDMSREDKVRLMKSRSYCGSCGKKGHWHRDPECPNYHTSAQGAGRSAKEVEMCHHVPAEVYSLRHEGGMLLGITDTACAKAVAGTTWLQQYSDVLKETGTTPQLVREDEAFKFGTGKVHHSSFHVVLCFSLGTKVVEMKTSIINGDVPLLMSKPALAQLGMIYDIAENRADFTSVGLRGFDLVTTSSGHPAIPIVPAKPSQGPERLVVGETATQCGSQYMAFALSRAVSGDEGSTGKPTAIGPQDTATKSTASTQPTSTQLSTTSTTKAPPYKIFYDKKLSPEVKELLTQDRLHMASFMSWWERTKIVSDFWLEGDSMWHRIHVVPRRAMCNPSTWRTQHTIQKNMLLQSVGDLRVTEGFCCKSGKPLETAVDRWIHDHDEACFPLLWVGRSSFVKVRPRPNPSLTSRPSENGMQQSAGDLEDDQDSVARGVQPPRLGCTPYVDLRGAEGDDHGASHAGPSPSTGIGHEVGVGDDACRAARQGRPAGNPVPCQDHQGQPHPAHQGRSVHAGIGTDEDRQVQGFRVPGDPAPVRNVGGTRSQDESQPARGTHPLRQVVGEQGVPGALRRGRLPGGQCDGPLPHGQHERSRVFRDDELACDHRHQSPQDGPRLADRPKDDEERTTGALRRTDGLRDRSRHPGGDPCSRDETGGLEAKGEGRGDPAVGRTVSFLFDSSSGEDLALPEEGPFGCEDTSTHHERSHTEDGRPLLHDQGRHHGQVHPHPLPRELTSGDYKHDGPHFGNKPIEHKDVCCGQDYDAATNDIFIAAEEFELAAGNPRINYECTGTKARAEDPFSQALKDGDFRPDTLLRLLNHLDYKPVKGSRDGKLGGKTGDLVNYFTYGMFTHGGVVGVTTKTREDDHVVRYLNAYGKHHLGAAATWTSVSLARDVATEVHHDYHNYKGTKNYSTSVGQGSGGGLWLEDKDATEDSVKEGTRWRKTVTGQWLPGKVHDTHNKLIEFDPFLKHATEPWTGTRWSLTYHTTRNLDKAGKEMRKFLRKCSFPLPGKQNFAGRAADTGKKPRASTRRTKKSNSRVASQIGVLVNFVDRGALSGEPGHCNIADWKSRAGQRICRSTFGAETQACAEGLETAQYLRSMYETMTKGHLVTVDRAELPILCLSDCRSLYDHLRRQGIPRVPSDKRLAVDLAALRQSLRLEKWCKELPIGWIPGALQKGDILTKPQNPTGWWEATETRLLLPLAIAEEGALISNRVIRYETSVKLESATVVDGILPYEFIVV